LPQVKCETIIPQSKIFFSLLFIGNRAAGVHPVPRINYAVCNAAGCEASFQLK